MAVPSSLAIYCRLISTHRHNISLSNLMSWVWTAEVNMAMYSISGD
jgi:hypothetical protein